MDKTKSQCDAKRNPATPCHSTSDRSPPLAFTLIELLAVIAMVAILAGLLLLALSRAKGQGQSLSCMNNLRQLQLAWFNYSNDNNDLLPLNDVTQAGGAGWPHYESTTQSWVAGNALKDTNDGNIKLGTVFPYTLSSALYRCPADKSTVLNKLQFPRARHYSMSMSMNGLYISPFFQKYSDIRVPAPHQAFVFIDEHPWSIDGDGWFWVTLPGVNQWGSFPDSRHQNGANTSFADGHVEHWTWIENSTLIVSAMKNSCIMGQQTTPGNRDLRRLQECIPR